MDHSNDNSDDNDHNGNANDERESQNTNTDDNNNNLSNNTTTTTTTTITTTTATARLRGLRGLRFILFIAVFGPPPLKLEEFERIPMLDITDEHVSQNQRCSICLSEFKLRDTVKHLVCGHYFHSDCVKRWLLRHGTCPYCRDLLINVRIAFNNSIRDNVPVVANVARLNEDVSPVDDQE